MMLAIALERLIPAKGIGVIHRALARTGLDVAHQFLRRHGFDYLGVDPAIALQEPENNRLSTGAPAADALASSAEVGLVQFNLAFEPAALQLRQVIQRLTHALIHAADHLHIDRKIDGQAIRRLQLIEPHQDRDLAAQSHQAFGLAAATTLGIPACSLVNLKRSAVNALAAPQKVGRTTEMTAFACNHALVQAYIGYETP